MSISGVITGDIVASRELSKESRKLLYSDLKQFLTVLKEEGWIVAFELFRGDSLQCVAKDNEQVLRVVLILRAWLKYYETADSRKETKQNKGMGLKGYQPAKRDIRLSIAIGEADLSTTSLAHSDGEVFYLPGEGLDNLKKSGRPDSCSNGRRKNEQLTGTHDLVAGCGAGEMDK